MGYKQRRDVPPMEREINYLLADLCVIWGFCIPPDDEIEISKADFLDAESFGRAIVSAEGMDPDTDTKWVKEIANKFKERFGTDEIDKSTFVDRVRGVKESW